MVRYEVKKTCVWFFTPDFSHISVLEFASSHMKFPTDFGTWGFILAIIAILLMYPVGILINITTPVVANWIARRSKAALAKRINDLENQLLELDALPAISEVDDEILWDLKRTKMLIITGTWFIAVWIVSAVGALSSGVLAAVLITYSLSIFRMRGAHDFRYKRSPRVRANIRANLEELRKLQ